jgi:hypothetical protein
MRRRHPRFFSDGVGAEDDERDDRRANVDELMADIAAIFHWSLADLERLDPFELLNWRRLAVERWNRMNGAKD